MQKYTKERGFLTMEYEKKLWRFPVNDADNISENVDLSYYCTKEDKIRLLNRATFDKRLNDIEVRIYMYLVNSKYIKSQEIIACDLDISRTTVNRALSRLASLGYIKINVEKKNVKGKIKSKSDYKVLNKVELIDTIEKLYSFIENKYVITSRNMPVTYDYTDEERIEILKENFRKFRGYEASFECGFRRRELKEKVENSIITSDRDLNKAFRILLFGAYIEEDKRIKFYTNDFIKHTLMDIDRNVAKLNEYQIMY